MALAKFLRRGRWDEERARELEAHLTIEIDANLARGMTPQEARDAARRRLGNTTLVREEIYRMNTIAFLEALIQDLRHGIRLLRLNPGFAAVAILSLALGVGANATMFQLLNALRIRTLPVARPEQLAAVRIAGEHLNRTGSFNGRHAVLTNPLWERIRDRQDAFSSVFALPFVILALVPQRLASLPRAGNWLKSVKVSMGLLADKSHGPAPRPQPSSYDNQISEIEHRRVSARPGGL